MDKNKKKNIFDFLPNDTVISYDEVVHNTDIMFNTKDPKLTAKLYYVYDKQTDNFFYFLDSNIFIFNGKGEMIKYARVELKEKIKIAAYEYFGNFLFLLTKTNKGIICDLVSHFNANYDVFDKGDFFGGFFIKRKNDSDEKYCRLCMVSGNIFIISKIYVEEDDKGEVIFKRKNVFFSKEMNIINYFYNSDFNVVIFKTDVKNFLLVNLKNKYCYDTLISLDHLNANMIKSNSIFMVRTIYHQLYFINIIENTIEFYGLKNLKNLKPPKIAKLEYRINFLIIKFQFYNNLVILYDIKNIYIYDIKSKLNNKVSIIFIPKGSEYLNFFNNMRIFGDYISIYNKFYKIKFLPEMLYKKKSKVNESEAFCILLRRGNCKYIIKNVLSKILRDYQISKFYSIIQSFINKNAKVTKTPIVTKSEKRNPYLILFNGFNHFYINHDEIFTLFNQNIKTNSYEFLKLIQLLGMIYNLYEINNIQIDHDVYISTLFYLLNQIKEFYSIDFLIKNNLIPLNDKLGFYLIEKAKSYINDKDYSEKNQIYFKNLFFNSGLDILNTNKEKIKEAIKELLKEDRFFDIFDLLIDYYSKNIDEQGTFDQLKRMMTDQFNQFNKMGFPEFLKVDINEKEGGDEEEKKEVNNEENKEDNNENKQSEEENDHEKQENDKI